MTDGCCREMGRGPHHTPFCPGNRYTHRDTHTLDKANFDAQGHVSRLELNA